MKTRKRLGALVLGTSMIFAVTTPVDAGNSTSYSGHWRCDTCEHNSIVYETSWTGQGEHYHKYKHDVSGWVDHHKWKRIS